MFEEASRRAVRFSSATHGTISDEDLWNITLMELDIITRGLSKEVKEAEEDSFITKPKATNEALKLKFKIARHIIKVRLTEQEDAKNAVDRKMRKEKIMSVIASKEDDALQGMSKDELTEMLNDL